MPCRKKKQVQASDECVPKTVPAILSVEVSSEFSLISIILSIIYRQGFYSRFCFDNVVISAA